uniref:Uncharacterized protein n=1 Tax=Pararge aegeria TaxID=116150 RepID=S4NY34_9NEOP
MLSYIAPALYRLHKETNTTTIMNQKSLTYKIYYVLHISIIYSIWREHINPLALKFRIYKSIKSFQFSNSLNLHLPRAVPPLRNSLR